MRHVIPPIRQSVQHLQKLLRRTSDARVHQRLQMLYLFKTEQARLREDAASLLGVHRNTIGTWLAEYVRAGIKGLTTIGKPEGRPPALDRIDQKLLHKRLEQSDGFASYQQAQQWIAESLGVNLSYGATHYWVHQKCGAKPKVARPSHEKKTSRLPKHIQA